MESARVQTDQSQTLTTCSRCKCQSSVAAAFSKEKHFFGLVTRTYCPDCKLRRQTRDVVVVYVLLPVLGLALYFFYPVRWVGEFFLLMLVYAISSVPVTLLHELAHTLAARLVDFRVFSVILGAGRSLFSGRFLGIQWEVRAVPLSGATILGGPPASAYRLRLFLIYLAGPLVHAAIAILSWLAMTVVSLLAPGHFLAGFFMVLFWGNLLSLAANLWPRKLASGYGVIGTDGWYLFKLFSMSAADLEMHYATYYGLEALDACRLRDYARAKAWADAGLARHPTDPRLMNTSGYVYTRMQDYASARQVFVRSLQADSSGSPGLKYMLLNNIAFSDLMASDPSLLPEADEYSGQAYQHIPWEPAIAGTRGGVLVALGRYEEGIPLLKTALAKNPDKAGKAVEACLIAGGEYRRGNPAEARRYLDTARMLDPGCSLIDRVGGEIGGGLN